MVRVTNKFGVEEEFSLSFDKIVAYEEEHPDWSIVEAMTDLGKKPRLSTLDIIASFVIDGGWIAWVNRGYDMGQLAEVVAGGLSELGFSSAQDTGSVA